MSRKPRFVNHPANGLWNYRAVAAGTAREYPIVETPTMVESNSEPAETNVSLSMTRLIVCSWLLTIANLIIPMRVAGGAEADPLDWHFWRGPEQNGVSRETGLPDNFDFTKLAATDVPDLLVGEAGTNVAWKRKDLAGRSTPIVMRGKLYTLVRAEPETDREGEKVVCLDAKTGKTLWENRFNVWMSEVPDTRVGWSSVIGDPETGNVFSLGVCGYFQCINGQTGETIWSIPLHEQFGLVSTYGGRTNFPVVFEDLVIVSAVIVGWGDMARPAHRFIAFDKQTGQVVWFNGTRLLPEDTTYSSPVLTVFKGQRALVFGSGDGWLYAFQPRTGKPIWEYRLSRRGLNQGPLVDGDTVYMGHAEENVAGTKQGAIAAIDGTLTGDITAKGTRWKVEEIGNDKCANLVLDGRLYVLDDSGKLFVFDKESGKRIAREALGTVARSGLLAADGKIYAVANDRWYILRPDEKKGVQIVKKGRFGPGEQCESTMICSHGRLYLSTFDGLYCLQDKSKEAGSTPLPQPAKEADAGDDEKPAHLQVVPAEVLVRPGETVRFQARLFNARGQLLRDTPAEYKLDGPGEISADGTFAVSGSDHAATIVAAQAAGLKGQARLRTVPNLPWSFDFDKLKDAPITWVGARYRHVLREVEGSPALVKVTTIPKGTKSRCWFGQSDLHDYTVQAEVQGMIKDEKLPDIGLITQGYSLAMHGQSQTLQIRIWGAQSRSAVVMPFAWSPKRWYVMKFKSVTEGNVVTLHGKVWPRGEKEPEAWTIEATDVAPNRSGSPGLFGDATNAEVFIDNVQVTPNEAS